MLRTTASILRVALIALVGTVGCGGSVADGGSAAIASTPLAGKIAGQAWSLGTAETDSFLSSSTAFDVSHYSDSFTACSGSSSQENYLSLNIPRAPGDYAIDTQGTATAIFVIGGSQNLLASSGHLVIDTVTSTTVTGGINVTLNGDNSVDGQFTATICR
jgi:hypothetical protein